MHFEFFLMTQKEHQDTIHRGINPRHIEYFCGPCGRPTSGRIVAAYKRPKDSADVLLCVCSCAKREASIVVALDNKLIEQTPEPREFRAGQDWPPDLAQLFEEASKTFAAGAYTATAMVCRKILMACACHEGDKDGKNFEPYVDYITNSVLTFPKARDAINRIRRIGNEANHKVEFVARDSARQAMQIVSYMLSTIYSLPAS